jgi:hypothetical protein
MDLESTLIRAEALFLRFQRTVEAIDRKGNFPAPTDVRQRRPGPGSPNGSTDSANVVENLNVTRSLQPPLAASTSASTTGTDRPSSPGTPSRSKQPEPGDATKSNVETRVITPELRALLSRKTPKLEKGEVRQHGGGVGT